MRKKFEWEWEILENNPATHTKRCKVIGGWIVNHSTITTKGQISESSLFVQDRDHEWIIVQKQGEIEAPEKKLDASEYAPLPTIRS